MARAGKIDPILGRDSEIRQIVDILTRRRQNNPILTGEAGVGKTAVVEGFALRVGAGRRAASRCATITVRTLDLGLLAGRRRGQGRIREPAQIGDRGSEGEPAPIILFIDEAHTLIGAGGAAGQGDAANLLKPALARGELRTIAATTWAEYKKYFEKDAALTRRFQVVKVEEPSEAIGDRDDPRPCRHARRSTTRCASSTRRSARRCGSRRAIFRAANCRTRRSRLIDTACARVAMSQSAIPAAIEDRQRRIALIDTEIGDPRPRDRDRCRSRRAQGRTGRRARRRPPPSSKR